MLCVNVSEVAATAASWARKRTQGPVVGQQGAPHPPQGARGLRSPRCYEASLGSQGWRLGVQSSPGEPWVLQEATSATRVPHIQPHSQVVNRREKR